MCKQGCLEKDRLIAASGPIREALILQEEILRHIPATALKLRHQPQRKSETPPSQGPLEFACAFYGIEMPPVGYVQRAYVGGPFVTNFEDLAFLTIVAATSLMSCTPELAQPLRGTFTHSMLLVMRLLGRMDQKLDAPFEVDWNPSEWLSIVLESVEYPVRRVLHDLLCVGFHSGLAGFDFHNDRSCRFIGSVPPSLTVDTTQVVDRQPSGCLKDDDDG